MDHQLRIRGWLTGEPDLRHNTEPLQDLTRLKILFDVAAGDTRTLCCQDLCQRGHAVTLDAYQMYSGVLQRLR